MPASPSTRSITPAAMCSWPGGLVVSRRMSSRASSTTDDPTLETLADFPAHIGHNSGAAKPAAAGTRVLRDASNHAGAGTRALQESQLADRGDREPPGDRG